LPCAAPAACLVLLAAGFYGSPSAVGLTTSACSGTCPAGNACPAGTTTPVKCLAGKYSVGGLAACVDCPAGTYGATDGLTVATCTAQCGPGVFSLAGATLCTSLCEAGYFCILGATSGRFSECPVGQYSLAGASSCIDCPGVWCPVVRRVVVPCAGICALLR
jgi:hypothetical protein